MLEKKTQELEEYRKGMGDSDDLHREIRQLKQNRELLEDKVKFF